MPEYSDYTPSDWGHDFADARRAYDRDAGRSYDDARTKGITAADLVPDRIFSDTRAPVITLWDQTGSMGKRPGIAFGKFAYVDNEARYYFGEDYAMAFGAFGDARNGETYPVQMFQFASGKDALAELKKLVIEGQGGGTMHESAELPALYVDRNVEVPNAVHPTLIFVTDEMGYDEISPDQARRWTKVNLQQTLKTKQLFESLKRKWNVFVIQMPYGENSSDPNYSSNREVRSFWDNLVGEDHVAFVEDPERVVDVMFGIFAKVTGKVELFYDELYDRQLKDKGGARKIELATRALNTIHRGYDQKPRKLPGRSPKALPGPDDVNHSMTRRDPNQITRRGKPLFDVNKDDEG